MYRTNKAKDGPLLVPDLLVLHLALYVYTCSHNHSQPPYPGRMTVQPSSPQCTTTINPTASPPLPVPPPTATATGFKVRQRDSLPALSRARLLTQIPPTS